MEEGGVCAKRRGGRASHARGSRRGRAEAREHAGDIPTCPGAKIGLIPKFSFPATFPSLPLNGLRLAHLARFGPKSRPKHGGRRGREEEGSGEPEEPEIYTYVARNVRYSPQATQIPQGSSGNRLRFENGPIKNRKPLILILDRKNRKK